MLSVTRRLCLGFQRLQMAGFMREEQARYGTIIRNANIKVE